MPETLEAGASSGFAPPHRAMQTRKKRSSVLRLAAKPITLDEDLARLPFAVRGVFQGCGRLFWGERLGRKRASAGRGARSGEKKERKQREARYKEMQQKSKKFRGEMRKNKFHADQMREEADEELRGIRHLLHPMMMTREEQKSTKHPVLVKLDKEIEGWKVAERPTADVWKQQQDLKKNSLTSKGLGKPLRDKT
ncbi:hypothetical protein T484DRAFT_1782271 [Baffinella frigidus]|nr:hypothetical protein T484DRAFT_1782271 [Cryptophyta sp. CCMP2293]